MSSALPPRRLCQPGTRTLPVVLVLALVAMLPPLAVAQQSPQSLPHYRLLEEALPRYRLLAARPELTGLRPLAVRSVKPGDVYADAPALRRLLVALGDMPDLPPDAGQDREVPAEPRLDEELAAGLRHFQERHGLLVDGILGPASWRALTTPLSRRVRQIELTLERWRALPPNPHRRAIFVNIPRFRLYAMDSMAVSAEQMLRLDVVVGRAVERLRTPTFVADLTHVIFRPYWDVPASIARTEILPAVRANPGYLDTHHFELVNAAGQVVPQTPANIEALARGTLRVRQRPGADNALGAVKFMLPNEHNVYLHDTPARTLFSRSRRDFSHGCIRVQDPAALARFVLQDDPAWTDERIAQAMAGSEPLRVNLAEPIRVYIVYGTAIAREDGSVLFLDDLYGLEREG